MTSETSSPPSIGQVVPEADLATSPGGDLASESHSFSSLAISDQFVHSATYETNLGMNLPVGSESFTSFEAQNRPCSDDKKDHTEFLSMTEEDSSLFRSPTQPSLHGDSLTFTLVKLNVGSEGDEKAIDVDENTKLGIIISDHGDNLNQSLIGRRHSVDSNIGRNRTPTFVRTYREVKWKRVNKPKNVSPSQPSIAENEDPEETDKESRDYISGTHIIRQRVPIFVTSSDPPGRRYSAGDLIPVTGSGLNLAPNGKVLVIRDISHSKLTLTSNTRDSSSSASKSGSAHTSFRGVRGSTGDIYEFTLIDEDDEDEEVTEDVSEEDEEEEKRNMNTLLKNTADDNSSEAIEGDSLTGSHSNSMYLSPPKQIIGAPKFFDLRRLAIEKSIQKKSSAVQLRNLSNMKTVEPVQENKATPYQTLAAAVPSQTFMAPSSSQPMSVTSVPVPFVPPWFQPMPLTAFSFPAVPKSIAVPTGAQFPRMPAAVSTIKQTASMPNPFQTPLNSASAPHGTQPVAASTNMTSKILRAGAVQVYPHKCIFYTNVSENNPSARNMGSSRKSFGNARWISPFIAEKTIPIDVQGTGDIKVEFVTVPTSNDEPLVFQRVTYSSGLICCSAKWVSPTETAAHVPGPTNVVGILSEETLIGEKGMFNHALTSDLLDKEAPSVSRSVVSSTNPKHNFEDDVHKVELVPTPVESLKSDKAPAIVKSATISVSVGVAERAPQDQDSSPTPGFMTPGAESSRDPAFSLAPRVDDEYPNVYTTEESVPQSSEPVTITWSFVTQDVLDGHNGKTESEYKSEPVLSHKCVSSIDTVPTVSPTSTTEYPSTVPEVLRESISHLTSAAGYDLSFLETSDAAETQLQPTHDVVKESIVQSVPLQLAHGMVKGMIVQSKEVSQIGHLPEGNKQKLLPEGRYLGEKLHDVYEARKAATGTSYGHESLYSDLSSSSHKVSTSPAPDEQVFPLLNENTEWRSHTHTSGSADPCPRRYFASPSTSVGTSEDHSHSSKHSEGSTSTEGESGFFEDSGGLIQTILRSLSETDDDAQTVERQSEGSAVAIDNKIEQAMDLVKRHLMYAVREEVEILKQQIVEMMERIGQLEYENTVLRSEAKPETLNKLVQPRMAQTSQNVLPGQTTTTAPGTPALQQLPAQHTQSAQPTTQPTQPKPQAQPPHSSQVQQSQPTTQKSSTQVLPTSQQQTQPPTFNTGETSS